MPLGYGKLFYNPRVNWAYQTESDPGFGDRPDYWPRGKVLGGSSSINAMVWARGHRTDYEDWGRIAGDHWGWDAVREAYLAIEDNEAGGSALRGKGGPLHIAANQTDRHPLYDSFVASATAARPTGGPGKSSWRK